MSATAERTAAMKAALLGSRDERIAALRAELAVVRGVLAAEIAINVELNAARRSLQGQAQVLRGIVRLAHTNLDRINGNEPCACHCCAREVAS